MAKFKFELEAVLEQRRGVERARQLAVAQLEAARMSIEQAIRDCQRQLAREKEDLREHLADARDLGEPRVVDLRTVRMQANASLHVVARAQQAVIQLAGVHHRLDAARLGLIEATTRRRAVEILRERRWEAWNEAQSRVEAASLDEMAIISASRQENVP